MESIKTSLFLAGIIIFLTASLAPAASAPKKSAAGADWKQKWEAVQAGAKKEGTLSVWTAASQSLRTALVPAMQEKFGINLEITTGVPAELQQKLAMERQVGKQSVDITILSPTNYTTYLKPKGMVTPLGPQLIIPEVKDDKYWINKKFPFFDKDSTVVALASAYFSYILVNTQGVKKGEIHGYRDLLNPKWKGKIIMYDPASGPGPTETFVNYFIPRLMGQEAGEEYLRALANQEITYTRDGRLLVESVAKGKYPIGIGAMGSVVGDFVKAGAQISPVRPAEGGLLAFGVNCLAIVDGSPHPDAATVFLNWILTDEGQRLYSSAANYPPRRLGVPFTGSDQFGVVRPNDKTIESDEAFYLEGKKTAHWAKEIFGPAVGK